MIDDVAKPGKNISVRAERCLGGWIQLDVSVPGITRSTIAISEQNAIALCNQLRTLLEAPTTAEPVGKNVVIMKVQESK